MGNQMFTGGSVTVFVSDVEKSMQFYTGTLGMTTKYHAPGHFAMVELPGLSIGLHPPGKHTPKAGQEGAMQIGLAVSDIRAGFSELKSRGVKFSSEVIDDGAVMLSFFSDPDGNVLYLVQLK